MKIEIQLCETHHCHRVSINGKELASLLESPYGFGVDDWNAREVAESWATSDETFFVRTLESGVAA